MALWALAGCHRHKSKPLAASGGHPHAQPAVPGAALSSQPAAMNAATPGGAEAYTLTAQELDKLVAYQQQVLTGYRALLEKAGALGADGGTLRVGLSAMLRSHPELRREQAAASAAAREQAGLSLAEVSRISAMVTQVVTTRQYAQAMNLDGVIAQFQKLRDTAPADQRATLDQRIAGFKAQRDRLVNLTGVRRRYGDKNVDLILTREKVLTEQWKQMVQLFAGPREQRRPAPLLLPNGGPPLPGRPR